MRSNKGSCGVWKEKWNRFWGEMYQVIKSLLYIFLNGTCSSGVVKPLRCGQRQYASGNFYFPKISPHWYRSSVLCSAIWPKRLTLSHSSLRQTFCENCFNDVSSLTACEKVHILSGKNDRNNIAIGSKASSSGCSHYETHLVDWRLMAYCTNKKKNTFNL